MALQLMDMKSLGEPPQRVIPPTLPADVSKRIQQLAAACKAVTREIHNVRPSLAEAGYRFPHSMDTELTHLDLAVDSIFCILNEPHVEKVDAENPA